MLDYQTKKELEEAWLCEMAYTRKKASEICEEVADVFMVHLCKCFLFSDTVWYQHWLKECGNYCVACDNIRLKPDGKRPNKDFFMQDDFICEEIETAEDAKGYLLLAIMKCPEVDRETEVSNDEALSFLDLWSDLRVELAGYFSDKETFDRREYMEIIDEAIKRLKSEV